MSKLGESQQELLFVHGFGTDSSSWDHLSQVIRAKYRCRFIDLLGYGATPPPDTFAYDIDAWSEQIKRYVDAHLNSASYGVVAHSLGGGLVLRAIISGLIDPNFVIFVDPLIYRQPAPRFLRALSIPLLGPLFVRVAPAGLALHLAHKDVYFDISNVPPDILFHQRALFERPHYRDAVLRTFQNLKRQCIDIPSDLSAICQSRFYLVYGDHDRVIPFRSFARLQHEILIVRTMIARQCGHAPQEECPEQFNALLFQILSEEADAA